MPVRGGLAAGHWSSSSSSSSQVQGSAAHAAAFSGGSGLARRWEQWQQARRSRCGTEAAAAAAALPPPQPQLARRPAPIMMAVRAAVAPTAVVVPSGGGARLTAAIKATRDPQALLELLRLACDAGGGGSRGNSSPAGRRRPPPPSFSSSSVNALHAAAALTHLAQLVSGQKVAEAAARGSLVVWPPRERAAGGEEEEGGRLTAQQPSLPPLLLSLAETHADRFTPRQCTNVMWAIAKLGWMDAGATAEEARRARRLVDTLAARLDGRAQPLWPLLQPQELVMALEAGAAVATAQASDITPIPTWLRGCLAALADSAPQLGAREHCSSAAALACLAAAAGSDANTADLLGRSLSTVVLDPALRAAWAYSPRDVAALLQALSLLPARGGGLVRPPPHAWTSAFLRAATDGPDARRAAAAGAAGVGGPLYMTDAAWSGRDGLERPRSDKDDDNNADADNDARAAASVLAALARLGFSPPAAWLAPRLRALGSADALRALGPGGLAILGHAVARSGARPPAAWTRAWLSAVLESWGAPSSSSSSSRRPPTSQEACMVLWTLAKLRARPSAAWMRALSAEAARAVARDSLGGDNNAAAVASSTVLWALARIGYRPSPVVERALLLCAVWMPDEEEEATAAADATRRLAVSLAAAARLLIRNRRRAAALADPLPPGVLTAWLRAAAQAGICDVDSCSSSSSASSSSSSLQRARATGAWALATLAAPVPAEWRRPFFAAAAAGMLRDSAVEEDPGAIDLTAASHRLDQAATVAWAAADERAGSSGAAHDAAAAALLAALALARRHQGGAWDCRRATSGALLCIWAGARMAQRQEEMEEEEAARRLRRATIGAMRVFAAAALDDEGEVVDLSCLSERDLLLVTLATALLGQERSLLPASWLALSSAARGMQRQRRRRLQRGSRRGDSAERGNT